MEKKKARNWYWWLWLSPLLTIPSLLIVYSADPGYEWVCTAGTRGCNWAAAERVTILVAILGSALWHLVLLIPARNEEHPLVRWHGRQALLLAGARTAVPLGFGLAFGETFATLLFLPVQLTVWFVGTLWGQIQAARGDCSLMRWLGQGELLASLQRAPEKDRAEEPDAEALVEIIRSSRDPGERRNALATLERRGMVEPL
jgi:hypothetical protein